MKFQEKNDFLVKHKSEEHYDSDLKLFKEHCPNSRLHSDLKRANSFNRKKLNGDMLWELLDKISAEEILKNRGEIIVPVEDVIIETLEQAKDILVKMEIEPAKVSEEFLTENIGVPVSVFESLMETLKTTLVAKNNKIFTLSILPKNKEINTVESIEQVKEIFVEEGFHPELCTEEFLLTFIGKTEVEIRNLLEIQRTFLLNRVQGYESDEETETTSEEETSVGLEEETETPTEEEISETLVKETEATSEEETPAGLEEETETPTEEEIPSDSALESLLKEKFEELFNRIDKLSKESDVFDYEISNLRAKLNEDNFPIEKVEYLISKLEKRVKSKKKGASKKSFRK